MPNHLPEVFLFHATEAQNRSIIFCKCAYNSPLSSSTSKIILISHLGRPKGIRDTSLSLLPIYKYLKEKLNTNMYFYAGEINDELNAKCSYLKNSEILLIENIRFFKEETDNEEGFSKKIGREKIPPALFCSTGPYLTDATTRRQFYDGWSHLLAYKFATDKSA